LALLLTWPSENLVHSFSYR